MTTVSQRRRKPPPPVSRAERKHATRELVRRAAWELFTTVGYDATTTKAIAARAGIAAGTLFVHASDKEDLLHLVMHDRLGDAVEEAFRKLPRGRLVKRLLHVFRVLFGMYAEHPGVAAAFIGSLPRGRGPNALRMTGLTLSFLQQLATLIVDAQAAGEVARDVDPTLAARNVFALYFMALLAWLNGAVSLEGALDPGLRAALELQIRGLAPR